MRLRDRFAAARGAFLGGAPRAAIQSDGPGTLITTSQQLEEALRTGNVSAAGIAVTPDTALRVAAVFGCVRLITGAIATLPTDVTRRVDDRIRKDASDHQVWQLMRRKPNRWQKPHQFKRMMQAHVLLRGNAYAFKVPGIGGRTQELVPLHPDRVKPRQLDDWTMVYDWFRKDGRKVTLQQDEIWHLFGLTLDGITGVTPLTYARETIGLSLAMDRHLGKVMQKGARASGAVGTEKSLTDKAFGHLKESLTDFQQDGDQEGGILILEEGLKYEKISLSPQDLQFIESRKLSRSEIAMFFGVPPHMLGDTEKSTSWGTGIEQQTQGFVTYTLQDHLTMWEEGITSDLIKEPDVFAKFNLKALLRGDLKSRTQSYQSGLQWGWMNPDEVRAAEDMNPREDGEGATYYDPPNTAGGDAFADPDDPEGGPRRGAVDAQGLGEGLGKIAAAIAGQPAPNVVVHIPPPKARKLRTSAVERDDDGRITAVEQTEIED